MFDHYCAEAQEYFASVCYLNGFGCSCWAINKRCRIEFSPGCDLYMFQDLLEIAGDINDVINTRWHLHPLNYLLLPKYAPSITERMIEDMGTALWRDK